MKNQTCRLCDADHKKVLFEKDGIPYSRCLDCGLLFSQPQTTANFASELDQYEPAYLDYWADSADDQRNLTLLLKWMRRFCPVEGKRVLDVGVGSGKFVRFLRKQGISAYGLEPAQPLYSHFLARDPFFFCDFIENFDETSTGGMFDIVVAWDVLEHVEQPVRVIQNMCRVLKPGGMLFLSTPDAGSLFPRVTGKWWHHYNKYHLSYFTQETLKKIAERHGLREVKFTHLRKLKSIGYVVQYLNDFFFRFRSERVPVPARIKEWAIPINLYDVMHAVFKKD